MNPWMQATGWTLIHFVWQGGLLALATAVGLRLCRRRSSEARYAIACAGLTAMLAAPVVTAAFFRTPDSALVSRGNVLPAVPGSEAVVTVPRSPTDDVSSPANAAATGAIRLDAVLPVVVWGWLAGVTALLARFAGGCWRVHRLRVAALAETVSQWQSASERLAVRLRLDVPFRVVESGLVDAPGVVGWIRPVILLPVAILANLTPVQIEAILAHELAHIRRRDYAVNLLQTVAETLLFYHPAVWWVSARVREEREHCCDDAAVEVVGEPAAYAQALADLASWRSRETALAVGATDGSLLARIRRLLHEPDDDEARPISGLVVLALGMSLAVGLAFQLSSSVVASDAAMQEPSIARSPAGAQAAAGGPQRPPGEWRVHKTDHFDIFYTPDLDLHAERVGREAERAHERVSSDLKHNLAFQVPVILLHSATSSSRVSRPAGWNRLTPAHYRILLATASSSRWTARPISGTGSSHTRSRTSSDSTSSRARLPPVDHRRPGGVRTRRVGSERSGHHSRRGSRQRDPENERAFRIRRQHGPAPDPWPRARGIRLHRVAMGQAGRAAVHLRSSSNRHQRERSVPERPSDRTRRVRSGLRTVP